MLTYHRLSQSTKKSFISCILRSLLLAAVKFSLGTHEVYGTLLDNPNPAPTHTGPSRGGKGGKVFPGPSTFGGPRRRSKILKMVFQMASFWPKICIKSIFGRGSAPDPAGGAYDAPPNQKSDGEGTPLTTFPLRLDLKTYSMGGCRAPRLCFPGPRCGSRRACTHNHKRT